MEIGHSTLLKFFTKDKPKMEKHTLKIENLAPSDVESEVPRQQKLREATTEPVREQVQNEVIEWIDLRDMIKKPVYMGLQEEVIRTQLIRAPVARNESLSEADKTSPENKPLTRIPVSKFKPLAERVMRERRDAPEANGQTSKREAPEKPRRTSIPKPKDKIPILKKTPTADDETPVTTNERRAIRRDRIPVMGKDHYKIIKKGNTVKKSENEDSGDDQVSVNNKLNDKVKTDSNEQLDDEFDKLYDEIVDNDVTSLPDEILETKVKDSEKLESKFEEIVHQYDDDTIEQVKIEPVDKARYSRIPLLRRRSSHDFKIPGKLERRLSLKTVNINKSLEARDEKIKDSKVKEKDNTQQNGNRDDSISPSLEYTENENPREDSIVEINNNDEINQNRYIAAESPHPIPDYNTIPTPDSELVKVGIFGISARDIPLEEINKNTLAATPELETVEVGVIDITPEDAAKYVNEDFETEETNPGHITETQEGTFEVEDDYKVIEDNANSYENNDIEIADKMEEDSINNLNDAKETIKYETIDFEPNQKNILEQNIPILKPDDLESLGLLKKTNSIEERTKSRYINKPQNEKPNINNVATLEGDVLIKKGKDASKYINEDFETEKTNPGHITETQEGTFEVKDNYKVIEDNANSYENNDIKMEDKTEEHSINNVNDAKDTIKYETIDLEPNQKNIPELNIPILKPDDDLKSFGLLKKTNSIEERTKSRYINKPQNEKPNNNNVATLEEDVLIKKGKVNSILKRLTSQEYPNREFNTNNSDDKKVMGVKEDVDNIPKKKSVLSKIAMFERADPEPTSSKKMIHRYSKPKRTISEEIKHSPKIVQEVLKPKGTPQTDNHTIVTVDIIKPVEVITNNEEQVTVVENLKEEEVIYDNFDDARLNQIESVELEPQKLIVADQNEAVSTVQSANNGDEYNKPEIRDQETNKDQVTTKENKPKLNEDHYERTANEKTNKNKYDNRDKAEKWKSTEALADFVPVKEKINRLKSYEDTNLKKAKSAAELDLGDAVKGKVKNMIVRMNSCELLDDVRPKEVISVKERPRKRSVSEKIALFERKLTPVAMENVEIDTGRALNIDNKPVKDSINSIQANATMEDYTGKIKQLMNAKLTYGSANMSYMQLRDGKNMPVIALGTALLDPRLAKHIVAAAIDVGYRAIDTAFIYGNEREVGEGIRAKIQDGTVRREELFIISKLWSTFHRPDLVETACRASLAATGLDYFDLFMIHNPMSLKEGGDPLPKIANVLQFSDHDYLDAWFAMEELGPKGLVRSIGVSNFNSAQLARVLEKGRIKPVVNQVECHPYLSQQRLSDFCEARDVRLSCFGVLGSKGTPAELKASQAAVIDDPLVQVMAAGLGISPAQLLIRYQIDSGHNVVVKASTAAHLWDNLKALNVTLEPLQIAALHALNKNKRTFTFKGMGDTHRNYPFRIAF